MRIRHHFRFRTFTWILALILGGLVGLYAIGCFYVSAPAFVGPVTANFDGQAFHNIPPVSGRRYGSVIKWMWTRKPGPWLEWVDAEPGEKPPARVFGGKLRATVVNHSTVLIQMDGLNILTDPVWSERIGPVSWAGPKRHRPPGIRFEDLPRIDYVLLSHNHYDHIVMPTIERLAREHGPVFYTGLGNGMLLDLHDIGNVREMDWWDEMPLTDNAFIAFVPARHFSSRGLCDRNRTLWGGFVISGPSGVVYFAGDTGMGKHLAEIKERYGEPRLELLPIGAFLPAWFMSPVHLSPEQVVEVHKEMGAGTTIPVHYGTFKLGDDGQFTPVERLAKELVRTETSPESFPVKEFGVGLDVK